VQTHIVLWEAYVSPGKAPLRKERHADVTNDVPKRTWETYKHTHAQA
jgi:hypothetical protein